MVEETSKDVYRVMSDAMRDTVYWAAYRNVNNAVSRAMSLAVSRAVRDTVGGVVRDTVDRAVYDSKHPNLQEFLYSYGAVDGIR